jgi:hypothetical protein
MAQTKTASGKVTVTGGKYFVTVNRKKHPLPVGTLIDPKQARKLAGKEVVAYLSTKPKNVVVAVQDKAFKFQPIWCYVPIWILLEAANPELQNTALNIMVKKGIIQPDLAEQFGAER